MEHDPDYVRMLENLPEEQRRAWLLGQWDIFEGQYFAEFDREDVYKRQAHMGLRWTRGFIRLPKAKCCKLWHVKNRLLIVSN